MTNTPSAFSNDHDALNMSFNYGEGSGPLLGGEGPEPLGDVDGIIAAAKACARFVGLQGIYEVGKQVAEESDDNDATFDRSSTLVQSQESSRNFATATTFSSGQ